MKGNSDKKRGFVYVAFGEPSRKCLVDTAIPAARRYMPEVPIAVISDREVGVEDYFIKHDDLDIGGRKAKLSVYRVTPKEWDYVIYMDADTELRGRIDFLFQILDTGWDFAICRHWGKHSFRRFRNPDNLTEWEVSAKELGSEELMAYQGGVFAFRRNPEVRKFFNAWLKEYDRWCKRDQAALVRALHKNPIKLYLLPPCWNNRKRDSTTVILHYTHSARRYDHLDFKRVDRLDSKQAWGVVR